MELKKDDVIVTTRTDIKIRDGKLIGYEPAIDVTAYCQGSVHNEYVYEPETNTCLMYARIPRTFYNEFKKRIDGKKIKWKKKQEISASLQKKSRVKELHLRDIENKKEDMPYDMAQ